MVCEYTRTCAALQHFFLALRFLFYPFMTWLHILGHVYYFNNTLQLASFHTWPLFWVWVTEAYSVSVCQTSTLFWMASTPSWVLLGNSRTLYTSEQAGTGWDASTVPCGQDSCKAEVLLHMWYIYLFKDENIINVPHLCYGTRVLLLLV